MAGCALPMPLGPNPFCVDLSSISSDRPSAKVKLVWCNENVSIDYLLLISDILVDNMVVKSFWCSAGYDI